MELDETIVAVASSHDSGGLRGIVRVSGPDTLAVVSKVFIGDASADAISELKAATRISGQLRVNAPFGTVASQLYLWPTKRSYTRQPSAEIHTHGSLPLLNAIVETVCECGARLARPGEFTLRAFLAGRIDLAQAEAVLGVIDAVDERELNVALEQLAGGLSEPLAQLRDTLLNLCADIEAGLDFVEDDIEFVDKETILAELSKALEVIDHAQRQMESREQTNQLPRVVLRGEPNVGKSSIWNAMCGDNSSAIVSDEAGTTRDYLCGRVTKFDVAFELVDTAGLEVAGDPLELKLVEFANHQSSHADLILLCIDGSRPLTPWEISEVQSTRLGQRRQVVITKADLMVKRLEFDFRHIRVSSYDDLSMNRLGMRCAQLVGSNSSVVANTVIRCQESLRQAESTISRAFRLCENGDGEELISAELRVALEKLGLIAGTIYTDDILDRVFSRFCIGK